jgi:hypothetical protein
LDLLLKYGVAYEHNVSFIDKVTKQKVEKVVRFNDPFVRLVFVLMFLLTEKDKSASLSQRRLETALFGTFGAQHIRV